MSTQLRRCARAKVLHLNNGTAQFVGCCKAKSDSVQKLNASADASAAKVSASPDDYTWDFNEQKYIHNVDRMYSPEANEFESKPRNEDAYPHVVIRREPQRSPSTGELAEWGTIVTTPKPFGFYIINCAHDRPFWIPCASQTCKRDKTTAAINFYHLTQGHPEKMGNVPQK